MTASALFRGRVRHTRVRPFRHDFSYRVFYALFDVDDLAHLDRSHRLFSLERFNLFSFRRVDHGPCDGTDLRPWAERILAEAGIDLVGGPLRLLAFPRVLGYVFNPISVWYCHGPDGGLRAVMHEVRNTFGDRHVYVVPVTDGDVRHEFAKELHVSPFMDMDSTYSFSMNRPGNRLSVAIAQRDAAGPLFHATLVGTRMPFTDRSLLRLFVTHPLMTVKAIGAIHWEAIRLWRRGARYRPRPEPAPHDITIVTVPRAA